MIRAVGVGYEAVMRGFLLEQQFHVVQIIRPHRPDDDVRRRDIILHASLGYVIKSVQDDFACAAECSAV